MAKEPSNGAADEIRQSRLLAFIGSSRVADILKQQHPKPHRLRCILGLEAKNAAIVLKNANLETAVKECVSGSLSYNGQRCTAIKMIFLHKDIAEDFLRMFNEEVGRLPFGMPWEKGVKITPLPEPGKTGYLTELLNDAIAKGARVINSGGGQTSQTMMFPAVVFPVNQGMRLYSEEQFGPVVPVTTFTDIEEPMQYK
jgi:glyceraldehyde-3-phosphate dehydrogenase (NADP+)